MIGKQITEENEKAQNFLQKKNNFITLLEQKIDERFKQEAQIREEIGNKLLSSNVISVLLNVTNNIEGPYC